MLTPGKCEMNLKLESEIELDHFFDALDEIQEGITGQKLSNQEKLLELYRAMSNHVQEIEKKTYVVTDFNSPWRKLLKSIFG